MSSSTANKRHSIRWPVDLWDDLEEYAIEVDVDNSYVITQAVEEFLDKGGKGGPRSRRGKTAKTKPKSIRWPMKIWKRLEKTADKQDCDISDIVRRAVAVFLKEN